MGKHGVGAICDEFSWVVWSLHVHVSKKKTGSRQGGASVYFYMDLYAGTVKCSPVAFNYSNCITIMKLIS